MKKETVLIAVLALWPFWTVAMIKAQQPEGQEQGKPIHQQTKPNRGEAKPEEPRQQPGGEMKTAAPQPQEEQRRTQQNQQEQVEEQQKRATQEQQKQIEEQRKRTQQQQADQQKRAQEDARKAQEEQQREQTKRAEDEGKRPQTQHQTISPPSSQSSAQRGMQIPDDRFRAHFGPEHHFRVQRVILIEERPRFQYSGYWIELLDPWPTDWSYTDDCYVDYVDDGYFLFSPLHPGVRIAVIVIE